MKRLTKCISLAALLLVLAGCDGFTILFQTNTVTVILRNDSDYSVSGTVYYDDYQLLPTDVVIASGREFDFDLRPGTQTSFSRNCDDLQVILVGNAELEVLGPIGPEASSRTLRDGANFNCGDTIVFTFDHSDLLLDFEVDDDVLD